MTIPSRRVPHSILRGHLSYLKCVGCLTLPTHGYNSKPANPDGLIYWCHTARLLASDQEVARFKKMSRADRCTAVFDGSRKFPKFRKSVTPTQERT